MTLPRKTSRAAFAVLALTLSSLSAAQMVQPIPGVTPGVPADTLSQYLRMLAANPRNLSALLGAGRAALDAGDPNAALGFFARADDLDPRNGRAKAGLAAALVLLEKPDDALQLFGQATALGVAEGDVARDRGLAYDLRGDNRRAQKDYVLALRNGPDDELIRRYALSLGISGDRSQALTALDPLLRQQDQAAWRARAFILAMNNDVAGANVIARQVMPASLAATMTPFLSRLSRLNPAERAHAVNFGTMPSDGQSFASVQIGDPFKPIGGPSTPSAGAPLASSAGDGLIPAGAPLGRRPVDTQLASAVPPTASPAPVLAADRVNRIGTRVGARLAPVDPARLPPEARGEAVTIVQSPMTVLPPPDALNVPVQIVAAKPVVVAPVVVAPAPVFDSAPVQTAMVTAALPPTSVAPELLPDAPTPERQGLIGPPIDTNPSPGFDVPPVEAVASPVNEPSAMIASPAPSAPSTDGAMATAAAAAPSSRLASILSGIEPEAESAPVALPTASEVRAKQRAAARKASEAAETTAAEQLAKEAKLKEVAAAKANPARLWVQVATGSNARGLTTTWKRIRDANATALKNYAGYSVAYRATNRVLAGPVKSASDARKLINALAKSGVTATTYGSEAGQEVLKLDAK